MRILFLAPHPFFQNRGTPIAVRMVLEWMSNMGYQVTLLTYPEGEDIELPGLRLVRLKARAGVNNVRPGFSWQKLVYDVAMYGELRRILKREPFDVIHAVEESVFLAQRLVRGAHTPVVYDMDSSMAQQLVEKMPFLKLLAGLFNAMEARAIRRSVGVLAVCRALEDIVKRTSPTTFVQRLEDGTLLPEHTPDPSPDQILDGDNGVKLLYVGNLEAYQGIDLMLEAFALCATEYGDAKLLVIGGTDAHIEHYRERVRQLGIESQVQFLGPRPAQDLGVYLKQADILLSARSKGINTPMKIYSYLDSGRVVLATRMLTHTQVMDDDIACLVNPDPASMAQGMRQLIADPSLRARLAAAASQRVEQEFSPAAFQRKLKAFYGRIENIMQDRQ